MNVHNYIDVYPRDPSTYRLWRSINVLFISHDIGIECKDDIIFSGKRNARGSIQSVVLSVYLMFKTKRALIGNIFHKVVIKLYHYIFSFNLSRETIDVSKGFVYYSDKIYIILISALEIEIEREREREREDKPVHTRLGNLYPPDCALHKSLLMAGDPRVRTAACQLMTPGRASTRDARPRVSLDPGRNEKHHFCRPNSLTQTMKRLNL